MPGAADMDFCGACNRETHWADEVCQGCGRVWGFDLNDKPTGVWAHIMRDHLEYIDTVHATEIEALRAAVAFGGGRVAFVPFGTGDWRE